MLKINAVVEPELGWVNPHLLDSQAVKLSMGIVGAVCLHTVTTEATTDPHQCQCQRHQQESDYLSFMTRAEFSA